MDVDAQPLNTSSVDPIDSNQTRYFFMAWDSREAARQPGGWQGSWTAGGVSRPWGATEVKRIGFAPATIDSLAELPAGRQRRYEVAFAALKSCGRSQNHRAV